MVGKSIRFFLVFKGLVLSLLLGCTQTIGLGAPKAIIWDTDMDSDCDDAVALAILHAMASNGEADILATMVSSKFNWAAPATDVINTYYKRPDIPIGAPKGIATPGYSLFAQKLAAKFPHDLKSNADAPDAKMLYRKILASRPDSSVTIVTVGDLTNLHDLINTPPDSISSLSGPNLVRKKVKEIVVMGSRYPSDSDPRVWGNFKTHPEAIVDVARNWPTVITFTGGGEFTDSLATGSRLIETPLTNPVRWAYLYYFNLDSSSTTMKSRHSADPVATYLAIRGVDPYFKLVKPGYNHVFANGTHEWRDSPDDPRHQYTSALLPGIKKETVIKSMEDLMVKAPGMPTALVPADRPDQRSASHRVLRTGWGLGGSFGIMIHSPSNSHFNLTGRKQLPFYKP